ncbi:hypothetical protein KKE19_03685 [Patescibacteria group bacterium]|nr:hypothetical protein [Patescibacteria group bacterium]MBU4274886.1 hypothetical protein [Patescibacteria group bacterium]MBU4367352.1 hypothetical protein [Patescibacteria group bacterium]MBU4461972.1 hypothetical protein [Patescibacteria group bacterium]MCG2699652.1 hypothetical protein [Candidatus Parcubacteria bacterium]
MSKLTKDDLLALRAVNFRFVTMSAETILGWFEVLDAGWLYQGDPDPAKPHAELTSGKCSNGYFDCRRVLCYPNLSEILAISLFNKLKISGIRPQAVVGSPYSAITFSYEVARQFGIPHFFAEKDPADPKGKAMVWKGEIPGGSKVLQVEELITTLGTTQAVRQAVVEKNPEPITVLTIVGTCIYRPDKLTADLGDRQIIALVGKEVSVWDPEQCPYCKVGSPRVRPRGNWTQLVGRTV